MDYRILFGFISVLPIACANDKTYVGVAFSPYVKNWEFPINEKPSTPYYNSYDVNSIQIMLRLISTKFNSIATFDMGVADYNINNEWDKTDSNCLVAKAAAELNKQNMNLTIKVAQGIGGENKGLHVQMKEIENAFLAANHSNTIFNGTVWALVFMNQAINPTNGVVLLKMLKENKERAIKMKLKIGPRIHNCKDIQMESIQNIFFEIVRESDFIMCSQYPNTETKVHDVPDKAAEIVFKNFQSYQQNFKSANENVEIILGQTGWPSKGLSFNNGLAENTIQNLEAYWLEITRLSVQYKIRTYLFEAFDEPWKSDYNIEDKSKPGGRCGAEGHFGWWRRLNNSDDHSNIEKITEVSPESDICADENKSNSGSSTGITIGLVLGVFVLIVVPFILFLVYRLQKAKVIISRLTEQEIEEFEKGMPLESVEDGVHENALLLPYDHAYDIPKDQLIIDKNAILGKGEFGLVYKGRIGNNDEAVAFKTVKSSNSVNHLKNLLSELKIMIYIGKHENIIGLLGAYTAEIRDGIVYIAVEFCSLGSLEKHLRSYQKVGNESNSSITYSNVQGNHYENVGQEFKTISISQLIKWCEEIACGMEWLASKKVIHADLATRNVLVTTKKGAKITDFGLSRRLYEYTNYVKTSQEPLPWRWMAIESLRSMNFSTHSDVWAYGITLWEIFTLGDIPYPGLSWQLEFVHQLEEGLRLNCPKYTSQQIYNQMVNCWKPIPEERPSFTDLVQFFHEIQLN